jgi:hypothetical protein
MRRGFLAVALCALVAGCAPLGGARYRVPIAEARQLLLAAELPPQVFGSEPPPVEVRAEGASDVVWIARRNDAELFRFVAHLSDAGGAATRVSLELKGGSDDIVKRLAAKPEIKTLYLVAMNERVASTLERREFAMSAIYPATAAATVVNMSALSASADQAAAASEKADRANIDKAYADEAAGRR